MGLPGLPEGSPEAPLGEPGDLLGIPRALLVALGGVFAFLGRSGSVGKIREIPGTILAPFWITFL